MLNVYNAQNTDEISFEILVISDFRKYMIGCIMRCVAIYSYTVLMSVCVLVCVCVCLSVCVHDNKKNNGSIHCNLNIL